MAGILVAEFPKGATRTMPAASNLRMRSELEEIVNLPLAEATKARTVFQKLKFTAKTCEREQKPLAITASAHAIE